MKNSNNRFLKKSIKLLKKLYIGGGRQPIDLQDYGNYNTGDISSIYEINRDKIQKMEKIINMLKMKGITRNELINIEGQEPNVNDFYILDDEDEIIEMLNSQPNSLKIIKEKDEIRKEIEKRNSSDPLTRRTGDKIPYLIDQHLLEKENA